MSKPPTPTLDLPPQLTANRVSLPLVVTEINNIASTLNLMSNSEVISASGTIIEKLKDLSQDLGDQLVNKQIAIIMIKDLIGILGALGRWEGFEDKQMANSLGRDVASLRTALRYLGILIENDPCYGVSDTVVQLTYKEI